MPLLLLTCGVIFVASFVYSGDAVLGIAGIVCLMLGSLGR